MKTGIHQPNFVPWAGYFRKISMSDTFVFFDNVQMPGGKSMVSRNAIKTAQGRQWLTVPVRDKLTTQISDVRISDDRWKRKHLGTLRSAYAKSPWMATIVVEQLESILAEPHEFLADLNIALIKKISGLLGFGSTKFLRASEMGLTTDGADSIAEILSATKTSVYVTGSGAGTQRHLDVGELERNGIETEFVPGEYDTYPQFHGDFEPNLSILDVLLCLGPAETRQIIDGQHPL
jgi:hypothetical protein